MIAMVLAATILASPPAAPEPTKPKLSKSDARIVAKLAAFIVARQKGTRRESEVTGYSETLARVILSEARRNRIPVTTLAAIGWTESHYWRKAKGRSYEYGVWQLWPYSSVIRKAWGILRRQKRIGTYPDRPWAKLTFKTRREILGDVVRSTALAALVLRLILQWCKRNHRIHPSRLLGSKRHRYELDRAAHYNSGTAWPRRGYQARLRYYRRRVQGALSAE